MKCPKCGSDKIGVNDTIPGGKRTIYRHRKCKNCGTGFRTMEVVDNGSDVFLAGFKIAQRNRNNKHKT